MPSLPNGATRHQIATVVTRLELRVEELDAKVEGLAKASAPAAPKKAATKADSK